MGYPAWDVPVNFLTDEQTQQIIDECVLSEDADEEATLFAENIEDSGVDDKNQQAGESDGRKKRPKVRPIVQIILNHSVSKNWKQAQCEWWKTDVESLKNGDESGECECRHPIRTIFHIVNRITGEELKLGSECIEVLQSGIITEDLINSALDNGIINDRQANFLLNTYDKSHLTGKQRKYFSDLCERIFSEGGLNVCSEM